MGTECTGFQGCIDREKTNLSNGNNTPIRERRANYLCHITWNGYGEDLFTFSFFPPIITYCRFCSDCNGHLTKRYEGHLEHIWIWAFLLMH